MAFFYSRYGIRLKCQLLCLYYIIKGSLVAIGTYDEVEDHLSEIRAEINVEVQNAADDMDMSKEEKLELVYLCISDIIMDTCYDERHISLCVYA